MDMQTFYQKISGYTPNPLQVAVWKTYDEAEGHPALLVKAGTGAGKTEAVLFPALADENVQRRILMILPSKALIEDMGQRVREIVKKYSDYTGKHLNLTVDMGGSCRRFSSEKWKNGKYEKNERDEKKYEWDHFSRHLFADDIIITTLDKFLFRIFGYGEKIKSYIFPHRIFGSAVEKKPFVIFDEAHEYDGTAFSNFIKLAEALFIKGKDVCVMSATLPDQFVNFLQIIDATSGELGKQQADFRNNGNAKKFDRHLILIPQSQNTDTISAADIPEPVKEAKEKEQKNSPPVEISAASGGQISLYASVPKQMDVFSTMQSHADITETVMPEPPASSRDQDQPKAAANIVSSIAQEIRKHYDQAKRMIARTESVSDLLKLYEELKDKTPLVYHGRMTTRQRNEVIHKIIECQEKNKGFLVLATSAIEAGCDLDAHVIVTELCNPDSLVQLAGRLNRRGQMTDAQLVIVGEKIKNFVSVLDEKQTADYLKELRNMGNLFHPENLKRFFDPPKSDRMGEVLFDMLWDYVYEADLTCKPLWDRGILVTRSWEPSVTLCTGTDWKTHRPENPIQVSVSRLSHRLYRSKEDSSEESYGDWLKKQNVRDKFAVDPDVDSEKKWHADLFRAFFNPGNWEESNWTLKPFTGNHVSCYEADLVCVIQKDCISKYFDPIIGYIRIPKIFLRGYRDGFRQYLDYHPEFKKDGQFSIPGGQTYPKHNGRVWYLDKPE